MGLVRFDGLLLVWLVFLQPPAELSESKEKTQRNGLVIPHHKK